MSRKNCELLLGQETADNSVQRDCSTTPPGSEALSAPGRKYGAYPFSASRRQLADEEDMQRAAQIVTTELHIAKSAPFVDEFPCKANALFD